MAVRTMHVTKSAIIATSVLMRGLTVGARKIHTGTVCQPSRLAIVNSPKTRASVSTDADMSALRKFGMSTRTMVVVHPDPSERDASTNVFRSSAPSPASSARYT